MPTRRQLFQTAAGLAAAQALPAQETGDSGFRLKLAKGLRDLADETLTFFKQLGVEHVVMPTRFNLKASKRGLVPGTDNGPQNDNILQPWDAAELERIKDYLGERGLSAEMVHLGRTWRVLHGKPDAAQEIENVQKSIRAVGEGREVLSDDDRAWIRERLSRAGIELYG